MKKKILKQLSTFKTAVECFVENLKRTRWKNAVPLLGQAYLPTKAEHVANIVTHGFCLVPVIYRCWVDLLSDLSHLSPEKARCCIIYSLVTIGLFIISTIFHITSCCGNHWRLRCVFHRLDRAMIYLFIAGSYTPWLYLKFFPDDGWVSNLRWAIWPFASIGILYQQLFHERFKLLETIFYIVVGVLPSLVVWEMTDDSGIVEMKMGGAVYLMGVMFFKLDGRIPFAHAIWHLHVVVGAKFHYDAVIRYLILKHEPLSL